MKVKPATPNYRPRGFAAMDPEKVRRITQMGGIARSRDREAMRLIAVKGGVQSGISKRAAKAKKA